MYLFTKAIKYTTKLLKQHCDTPLATTFGMFLVALVHLSDAEPSNDFQKEELTKRSKLSKALFLEVIQKGITSLRKKYETEMIGNDGHLQRYLISCVVT